MVVAVANMSVPDCTVHLGGLGFQGEGYYGDNGY